MQKERLFGTDGVRGIANIDITPELAYKLGKAAANILKGTNDRNLFIVGTDTRISANLLSHSLISGLLSSGVDVLDVGVIPTPAIAYLVRAHKATAGVMISASHNPYNYNGIKFFNENGYKLPDNTEDFIQSLIESNFEGISPSLNENIGISSAAHNLSDEYKDFLISLASTNLNNLKIALDCGHGATYKLAETIFSKLGADVTAIHTAPNGVNINKNCGSTHLEQLKETVIDGDYDMGFAFDGDGDRCLAIDNTGQTVDGDKILAICGKSMLKKGTLRNNTIVSTVMSNLGFMKAMESLNINAIQAKVGDRYVLEEMLNNNHNLGGEQSGHIIFSDYNSTGDGLLTAIQLACICKEENQSLHELASIMTEYPQTLVNVTVPNNIKNSILKNSIVLDKIKSEEARLNGDGRVLVRVSGTEPLIRVMVEGAEHALISNIANNIADMIKAI